MKKLFALLVCVSMLVALVAMPLTVNAAEEGFVTVTREFTITEDNIKEGETTKLNPRLWWQFKANTDIPFAFEIANVTIKDSTGAVVDKFIASANDSLQLGSAVPPADFFSEKETLIVKSGWTLGGDNQVQVWSNGTKDVKAGDYTFNIDIKITDVDDSIVEQIDQANVVRLNIWNDNLAAELFPTDENKISLEELQEGTAAFNGEEPDDKDPTEKPTEKPTDKPGTEKPVETSDASMLAAILVAGAAAVGSLKSRKK